MKSKTINLLESIRNNINEEINRNNELLNAVKSVFDKNAKQFNRSISVVYDGIDLWITDAGQLIKLDTKKDKGSILHTQKGDMLGPSLHISVKKTNDYISDLKSLKSKLDAETNIEIKEKYIVRIDDKYLGNDGNLVSKEEATIYDNYDKAQNDLSYYISDNQGAIGEIIEL